METSRTGLGSVRTGNIVVGVILSLLAMIFSPIMGVVFYVSEHRDCGPVAWLESFFVGPAITVLFLGRVFEVRRDDAPLSTTDAGVAIGVVLAYWSLVAVAIYAL